MYGAFPQMGAPAGTATATLAFWAVSRLPDEQFLSWGWRIPFLLSALLIVVGLLIRLWIMETPLFTQVKDEDRVAQAPVVEADTSPDFAPSQSV